jgi:hypothetical protein
MAAFDALVIEEAPGAPDIEFVEAPTRAIGFCPRCALILAGPLTLRKHLAVCSGTG